MGDRPLSIRCRKGGCWYRICIIRTFKQVFYKSSNIVEMTVISVPQCPPSQKGANATPSW